MMTNSRLIPLSLAMLVLAGSVAAAAVDVETQVQQARLRQVIEQAGKAYVFIGGGSGAIISSDGYVITNNHVAGSAREWRLKTAAGDSYRATVVGLAPMTDLALLKIRDAKNLPFLPVGDSDRLTVGEQVVAIGNPFALGNTDHMPTITLGIVSAVGINGPNAGDVVVTDAPTNPGNSGGPLINLAGQLVGVNYAQMPSRFGIRINTGSGYAISSNQLKRFLDSLKSAKGGKVDIGAINGVHFDFAATTQPDEEGAAIVRKIEPGSQADRAGIKPGDRIVSVGPWQVLSLGQLFSLTARYPAGKAATIGVQRGRLKLELDVKLAAQERVGLGVVFESASKNSLKVERVLRDSPAHLAGIRPGDAIRGIGAVALPTRQSLATLLSRGRPGQTARVIVLRRGRQMTFTVELIGESELARLVKAAATQPEVEADSPATQPEPPTSEPEELLPPPPDDDDE